MIKIICRLIKPPLFLIFLAMYRKIWAVKLYNRHNIILGSGDINADQRETTNGPNIQWAGQTYSSAQVLVLMEPIY